MKIKTLCVGPIGTNCYLLCDDETRVCAVIDPGGDAGRVTAAAAETGCSPCAIFLTHGHYDHTGAVAELRKVWPEIPVYLNRRDRCGDDPYLAQLFPPIPDAADYDRGGHAPRGRSDRGGAGDPRSFRGVRHSSLRRRSLLRRHAVRRSCGRTDFPGGSVNKILASLRRLGQLEGDLAVYPGHMESSTLDQERRTNPFLLQALGR